MQEIAASQVNPRTPMLTAKLTVTVSGCHDSKRYLKALIHTLQVHAKPAATNECSVIENACLKTVHIKRVQNKVKVNGCSEYCTFFRISGDVYSSL